MSDSLFSSFTAPSKEAYRDALKAALKGKPEEEFLLWETQGIAIPSHHHPTVPNSGHNAYAKAGKLDNNWFIGHSLKLNAGDPIANRMKEAQQKGATAVFVNGSPSSWPELMRQAKACGLALFLSSEGLPPEDMDSLGSALESHPNQGGWLLDPISHYIQWGDSAEKLQEGLDRMGKMCSFIPEGSLWKCIAIDGAYYQNAGASLSQEIGFALAQGNEYLTVLQEKGHQVDDITALMQFQLASGPLYFLEIAKLRAFRRLWATVVNAHKPVHHCSQNTSIHSQCATWHLNPSGLPNNLLRITSSAMAAIIGGCDSYALPLEIADEAHHRLAQNIQLLLRDESHLDYVLDASQGAYYIDYATEQLAEAGWKWFQEIEAKGGLLACAKQGFVKETLLEAQKSKQEAIQAKKETLIGVNAFVSEGKDPNVVLKQSIQEKTTASSAVVQPWNAAMAYQKEETS